VIDLLKSALQVADRALQVVEALFKGVDTSGQRFRLARATGHAGQGWCR